MSKSMYGLTCPCGHDFEAEDLHGLITYWGSDGDTKELECPNCERTLTVREIVTRTFEVSKIESATKRQSV